MERHIIKFFLCLTAVFVVWVAFDLFRHFKVHQDSFHQSLLSVNPQEVIGGTSDFRGDPAAKNILVEFADYQCPACIDIDPEIARVLNRYHGHLRFAFRNLPLTQIHQYALTAAIHAEAARMVGRFWQYHDALYSTPPDKFSVTTIEGADQLLQLNTKQLSSLWNGKAKTSVEADIVEANRLGLHSTPSFILCRQDGIVLKLKSLSDLKDWMQ